MKVLTRDDWMVFTELGPFDLQRTLVSGQTFRWVRKNHGFEGVVRQTLVEIRQEGDALWARTSPKALDQELIEEYFCLNYPLEEALAELAKDKQLAGALQRQSGIRLLRQEPWECLVSFILAINKSIPQIEKTIVALCDMFGRKVHAGEKTFSVFPTPQTIAAVPEEILRKTKMGFRARYLKAAAEKVVREQIDLVPYRQKSYSEAKELLLSFYGIGPKVADCICLFALGHQEAFPVDVWIARAMERYYLKKKRSSLQRVQEVARKKFGNLAGLAQQYMYHDIRSLAGRST